MSDIDFERVSHLLNIVERAAGHSGKLNSISNAAMAELLELDKNIKAQAKAKAKKEATAKAEEKKPEPEPEPEEEKVSFVGDTNPSTTRRI